MTIPTMAEYMAAQKQKTVNKAMKRRMTNVFVARYRWPEESLHTSVRRSLRASPYLFKGMTEAQVYAEAKKAKL